MKLISEKDSNKYFQLILESINNSYRDAMIKGDINAIQGLCSLDISHKWAQANTGSYVLSHLFQQTIKKYKIGGSMPWIDYDKLTDDLHRSRKINEMRIDMVRDALITKGFAEINQGTINTLENQSGKIITTKIRLTKLWEPFLNKFLRQKFQTSTFPHILGRQIYLSYLAELKNNKLMKGRGSSTGVTSFKIFPMIFNQLTPKGYVDNDQCEKMFHKQGGEAVWHDFCESDGIKQAPIRFFIEDNLKLERKKINENSIKAWNKYVLPQANVIFNKNGMTL